MTVSRKTLAAAGIVAALAAAAGGFVAREASLFDAHVEQITAPGFIDEDLTIVYEEIGKSFFSRDFRIRAEYAGAQLVWVGRADFGAGISGRLSLDQTQGLGTLLPRGGVAGLREAFELSWTPWGGWSELVWTASPFVVKNEFLHWRSGAQRLVVEGFNDPANARGRWTVERILAGPRGEKAEVDVEKLEARWSGGGDAYAGRFDATAGAWRVGTMSGASLAFSHEVAPELKDGENTPDAKPIEPGGVLATLPAQRYVVAAALAVERPELDGIRGDRFVLKSRTTGLTPGTLERFAMLGTAALAGGMSDSKLLALFERLQHAFVTEGLAWELDECTWSAGEAHGSLAGRMAYVAPEKPGAPARLGAFELIVPEELLLPEEAAGLREASSDGRIRLVEGRWTTHLEIFTDRVLANGVRIF